jgi:hypothetical protein
MQWWALTARLQQRQRKIHVTESPGKGWLMCVEFAPNGTGECTTVYCAMYMLLVQCSSYKVFQSRKACAASDRSDSSHKGCQAVCSKRSAAASRKDCYDVAAAVAQQTHYEQSGNYR